jgi:hypothetical protein
MKPLLAVAIATVAVAWLAPAGAAHRNICHRLHTCPADYHAYRWRGLLCTSFPDERLPSDKIVVHYGGRTYWCHR